MAVVDSYSETNRDGNVTIDDGSATDKWGQSFTGDGSTLTSVQVYIGPGSSNTLNTTVEIYAHSGTYGTSSVPTGSALATSDAVTPATIGGTANLVTFAFSGANQITLTNATKYCFVMQWVKNGPYESLPIYYDGSSPTHAGNAFNNTIGTYVADNTKDIVFYVNGTVAVGLAITTNAVTAITTTTATGNGNITDVTSGNADERGIVYSTSTQAAPGNVAPGSSGYSGLVNESGSYGTGAFTESLTGLSPLTRYYARAYAHNTTDGYIYGNEVNFITGLSVAWFRA